MWGPAERLGGKGGRAGGGGRGGERCTFNAVRLGQLRAILHQFLGQGIPDLALCHAQIDVCAGEVVGVELWRRSTRISSALSTCSK